MRKRLIATLGACGLLVVLLAVSLLRGGPATSGDAAPLAHRGSERDAAATYAADEPAPARAPAAAAEAPTSAPLLPSRVSLSVTLPRGVRAAGDVFLHLSAADDSFHAGRLLNGSATWDELLPGEYELRVDASGWSAPEAQLSLARDTQVELVPRNRLDGMVVESRSRRRPEGAALQLDARVKDSQDRIDSTRSLFATPLPLPDGAFSFAGLGLAPDVEAVRARVSIGDGVEVASDWLPVAPRPFWSGVVIEVPDLVVRGHVTGAELPNAPIERAQVVMVPADVTLDAVRFADGELFLAPQEAGGTPRPALGRTLAGDDGSFALRSASLAASARVVAWEPGRMPALSEPFALPADATPAQVDLQLVRGGQVRVVVHVPARPGADGDGLELRPVRAALEAAGGSGAPGTGPVTTFLRSVSSDTPSEAAFEGLFDGLSEGDYLVSALLVAGGPDGASRTLRQQVAMPQCARVQADLRPDDAPLGVHVRGRVLLPADFVIADSDVTLVRRGAPIDGATLPQSLSILRPDGSFDLPDVLPGEQLLAVRARNPDRDRLAFATLPLTVGSTDVSDVTVDLTTPEVNVRGVPELRDQSLVLTSATGSAELDALLGLGHIALVVRGPFNGEARIYGLQPGRYALAPRKDAARRTEFELGEGQARVDVAVR
ncbi:MAG TPA: hypothetical protein VFY71_09890 [Planctomycetota bacterium]|nr:hypothetical protein [Planctomycetota bacterium]